MSKRSGSRPEFKKIKKVKAKASQKRRYSISNSSSSDSDLYSSLSSDSEQEQIRYTTEHKDINKLDHAVIDNIKKNKNKNNDAM